MDGWSPTELLARLAARGPQPSMAPGGKPKYAMEDIAGALAGLPYPVYCYARVKFCGDDDRLSMLNLHVEVRRKVMMWAKRERWKGDDAFFSGISALVATDAVRGRYCKSCKGTGLYTNQTQCRRCKGSGVDYITHQSAAKAMGGMSEDNWRKTWAGRYLVCLGEVQAWDSQIEAHLRKFLLDKPLDMPSG